MENQVRGSLKCFKSNVTCSSGWISEGQDADRNTDIKDCVCEVSDGDDESIGNQNGGHTRYIC